MRWEGRGGVKSGQASTTEAMNLRGLCFYLLLIFIYHLLTESEVITGKSQTEVSLGQYIKAEVWDFAVVTGRTRLISYLFYGLFIMACGQMKPLTCQRKTVKNMSPQWGVHLSPWYSHVTLVSGYPFWQLSIGHNIDVHYQVEHRLYMSWTLYSVTSIAQSLQKNNAHLAANHSMCTIVAIY